MSRSLRKIRLLPACCLLSILCHVLSVYAFALFGRYDFSSAVSDPAAVTVDLAGVAGAAAAQKPAVKGQPGEPQAPQSVQTALSQARKLEQAADEMPESGTQKAVYARGIPRKVASAEMAPQEEDLKEAESAEPEGEDEAEKEKEPARPALTKPIHAAADAQAAPTAKAPTTAQDALTAKGPATPKAAPAAKGPTTALAGVSTSLASRYEKLSYRVVLHGIPVATAELEAKNDQGMTTITMKVRSTPAISSVFPVDDLVQTQQIGGLYVMAKIKQQEGNFRSDETFTINLRKKTVTWFDLANPRIMKTTVPTDDVLDSLSGIYYLRNRHLQVGKTETLHIFDSESYGEVPVEVLRREEVRLPNLSKVATVVVRPLQKTAGIFRRTGEVLMWMTDDQFKVPVRIESSTSLGKVTAELVNAESKPHAEEQRAALR